MLFFAPLSPFQFFAPPSSFQFLNVATVVGGATVGASLPHHLRSRSAGGQAVGRWSLVVCISWFCHGASIWFSCLCCSMVVVAVDGYNGVLLVRRSSLKPFRVGSIISGFAFQIQSLLSGGSPCSFVTRSSFHGGAGLQVERDG